MKKIVIFCLIALAAFTIQAQPLAKGNLIGLHVITMKLNPGVTDEQVSDFFINNYVTAANKAYPGVKHYAIKGIRGEQANQYGMMVVFNTEADRNKYYKPEGGPNELGLKAEEMLKPVQEAMARMGTFTTVYTDWIVQ
jgi:hypothetical protein